MLRCTRDLVLSVHDLSNASGRDWYHLSNWLIKRKSWDWGGSPEKWLLPAEVCRQGVRGSRSQ